MYMISVLGHTSSARKTVVIFITSGKSWIVAHAPNMGELMLSSRCYRVMLVLDYSHLYQRLVASVAKKSKLQRNLGNYRTKCCRWSAFHSLSAVSNEIREVDRILMWEGWTEKSFSLRWKNATESSENTNLKCCVDHDYSDKCIQVYFVIGDQPVF